MASSGELVLNAAARVLGSSMMKEQLTQCLEAQAA